MKEIRLIRCNKLENKIESTQEIITKTCFDAVGLILFSRLFSIHLILYMFKKLSCLELVDVYLCGDKAS